MSNLSVYWLICFVCFYLGFFTTLGCFFVLIFFVVFLCWVFFLFVCFKASGIEVEVYCVFMWW